MWVAHFRKPNAALTRLLIADQVLWHPLVLTELACGTPPAPRAHTLGYLQQLRSAAVATTEEALALIERHQLQESGCGAIDMLLLGSVLLTPNASLWTLDKSLGALAVRLGVDWDAAHGVN